MTVSMRLSMYVFSPNNSFRFFTLNTPLPSSWVVEAYFSESDLARLLQLGKFSNNPKSYKAEDGVIDVVATKDRPSLGDGRK